MPDKEATDAARDAESSALHALFGSTDAATSHSVTTASLSKLTLKQLLDGAKSLGLTEVSKLKKEALVQAVMEAWHGRNTRGEGAAVRADSDSDSDSDAVAVNVNATDTNGFEAEEAPPPFSHKFELGQSRPPIQEDTRRTPGEQTNEIPWGYGRDRVTTMPVDPDRLYAYWEVLDDSMAQARAKLGLGGPDAWLNLRVYDVTGRIFDGTNAHSVSDYRIERGDRQWFVNVGKPTSAVIVEIGMKSHEGYFVKIARAGRVEFPRREPVGWADPEWLTVRAANVQTESSGPRWLGRPARPPGPPSGVAGVAAQVPNEHGNPGGARHLFWEDASRVPGVAAADRQEWEAVQTAGVFDEYRTFHWDGPMTLSTWEAGPFSYPVEIPEPVRESFVGKTRVYRVGGRTHMVYGPWQVVIRGLGAQQSRAVLSRWEVYRTWAQEVGRHVEELEGSGGATGGGSSERMMGSSERRWAGASELRFGGSSELHFLKASEIRLGGASEAMSAGASAWLMRGASERVFAGASEVARRGASEHLGGGSSERFLGGSEGRLGGGGFAQEQDKSAGAASAGVQAQAGAVSAYPAPEPSSTGTLAAKDNTPIPGGV